MKRRKQILAVLLAGAMTVPMALPVQAAESQIPVLEGAVDSQEQTLVETEQAPIAEIQDETEDALQEYGLEERDSAVIAESDNLLEESTGITGEAQETIKLSFENDLSDSSAGSNTVIAKDRNNAEKAPNYADGVKSGTKAIKFDGDTYLDMGTSDLLNPSNLTTSFWMKPESNMVGEQIFVWNKAEYDSDGWYLTSEDNNTPLALSVGASSNQPYKVGIKADRATFFPVGEWTHVAVTFDNETKEVAIYRNGIVQDTVILAGDVQKDSAVIQAGNKMQKSLGYNGPVYKSVYLTGVIIDEFSITNTAKSAEEIHTVYEAEKPDTGNGGDTDKYEDQLLHLSFEGNLTDSSAANVEASIDGKSGAAEEYIDGVKEGSKAFKFNGNTFLNLGTSKSLNPSSLSTGFWVKPMEDLGDSEQIILWNKERYNSDGWYITSQSREPLSISIGSSDENKQPYRVGVEGSRSDFFPVGEWTHVVITFDGDTKEVNIYRDGIEQKVRTYAAIGAGNADGTIEPENNMQKALGYNGPVYNNAYSTIGLDEFMLKDTVMTADEAAAEFHAYVTDEEILQRELNRIKIPAETTDDIVLPQSGQHGEKFSWLSDNKNVISDEGKVTRPAAGQPDIEVKLTVVGTYKETQEIKKDFTVKVKARREVDLQPSSIMGDVNVADSYLMNAESKETEYLLSMHSKKFLFEFYRVAGLDPVAESGFDAGYGGWERTGASNFRSHTFGHYMSALSQAYLSSDDSGVKGRLLNEIQDAVNGLEKCQNAFAEKYPEGKGYISAFPEGRLSDIDGILSAQAQSDGSVLVPYYNLHKVLAGLIDISKNVDNKEVKEKALTIAENYGEYFYNRLSKLTDKNRMLQTEYGGMNESLYELYNITENDHFKTAAEYFDETDLFQNLAAGRDVLDGKHANTTIPKLIGALKRYTVLTDNAEYYSELTADEKSGLDMYKNAAINFWDIVIQHHTYVTGGNSAAEHFHAADRLEADASSGWAAETCETCNTYNMLKLSKELYKVTGEKKYMDYFENTFINAILSSQNPETGTTMYFQPMAPGYNKVFNRPYDEFWCCTGTGMENFSKLGDNIYAIDNDGIRVNMFFSSSVNAGGTTVTQTANIPSEDTVRFSVSGGSTTLKLRKPDWLAADAQITVGGNEITLQEKNGYYMVPVNSGETVEYKMPMKVQAYATQDNSNFVAFRYGPVVLSTALSDQNVEASDPTGILVRKGTFAQNAQTSITVENYDSVEAWKTDIEKNLVRIEDDENGQVQFKLKNTDSPDLIYTPHYRRYKEYYGLYMYINTPDSDAAQNKILHDKELLREEEFNVDYLNSFDDNNYESAKNLQKSDDSSRGVYSGRQFRHAEKNGWFSYDLKVDSNAEQNYLNCTFYSGDRNRTFDICINDEVIETYSFEDAPTDNKFFVHTISISPEMMEKVRDNKLTFKFKGGHNTNVGGLFGISTTTSTTYDSEASLKSLNFDKGTLTPAFTKDTKEYTLTVSKDTETVAMTASPKTGSGLIYVNGVLIDDSKTRHLTLTSDMTDVSLETKAQDHTTSAQYTIHIVKSDDVKPEPTPEPSPSPDPNPGPGPNPSPDPTPTPNPTPVPDDGKVVVTPEAEDKGDGKVEVAIPDVSMNKPDEKKDVIVELPKDDLQNIIQNSKHKDININVTIPDSITNSENVNLEELKLPKEVFQSAKDEKKDITVTVTDSKDNTYSWSFSGKDVDESKLSDVNLKLDIRKASDDEQVGGKLYADESGIVIDFAHNGELPAEASVTIDAEALGFKPGDKVTLYYFNEETGKLEAKGKSYKVDKDGKVTVEVDHCSKYVIKKTTAIKVDKMTGVKTTVSSTAVRISWKKNPDAAGYRVYRYSAGKKKYEKIADVKGISYTDKGLKSATAYRYAVRAYVTASKTYYSSYIGNLKALTKPVAPASVKAKRTSKVSTRSTATISFKKVDRASTYRIYKYNKKTKKYAVAYRVVKNKLYQYNSKTKKYKKVNNVKVKNGVITCSLKNLNLKSEKSQKYVVKATVSKSGYKTQYSTNSKTVIIK